jgi:predicted Rossmann fold nucleotide-binding protein DprA/Smf involved in DNA uptake
MMDSEMKVAIVGSRNYHPDLEQVKKYVRKLSPGDIIVSGGGNGVDETVRRK